ncbi:MAG: DUF192 domain-containing protein [Armatimonadetes bacterium]|nr:DUF192 domain-containing protein [Armatimonadota bacterium]
MKTTTAMFFATLLLLGCGGTSNPVNAQSTGSGGNTGGTSSTGGTTTGGSTGSTDQDTNTHRNIKERVYQLDELEVVEIKIGANKFKAWVMDTAAKREEGMMFVENADFKDEECMIFVFKQAQELSFWMHNTLVDLDIAYVGADKKIVRAVTMKALDETGVPSYGKSQYAIEFRGGLFKKLGIAKGMAVTIPNTVKAKD